MKRFMTLSYGVISYVVFLGALVYLIGFLNNFLVPKGIDDGGAASLAQGLSIDVGLILLFAFQHTIMARPWFKSSSKRVLPEAIERSTFVLLAGVTLLLLFWQWRPLPGTVWHVDSAAWTYAVYGLQVLGWGLVLLSTFLINHFELFGLQQVYLHWRRREARRPTFRVPWLYRLVRHPLMLGFLVAFWSVPHMTQGHLVFTLIMTAYIFVGIYFEERDLLRIFGQQYSEYQQATPMIVPVPRREPMSASSAEVHK
jgi:protein-S-isoprenylcysteine O-methyltransferase Ste14